MRRENPLYMEKTLKAAENLASIIFPLRDAKAEEQSFIRKSQYDANNALARQRTLEGDAVAETQRLASIIAGDEATQKWYREKTGQPLDTDAASQLAFIAMGGGNAEQRAGAFTDINETDARRLVDIMRADASAADAERTRTMTPLEAEKERADTLAAIALGESRVADTERTRTLTPVEAEAEAALARSREADAANTEALTPLEIAQAEAELAEAVAKAKGGDKGIPAGWDATLYRNMFNAFMEQTEENGVLAGKPQNIIAFIEAGMKAEAPNNPNQASLTAHKASNPKIRTPDGKEHIINLAGDYTELDTRLGFGLGYEGEGIYLPIDLEKILKKRELTQEQISQILTGLLYDPEQIAIVSAHFGKDG